MCLKITLYSLFVPEEGSSHSSRIHKCQCANILCYSIRLHFSSFLCRLDLFLTPFASFPKSIIVDIGEEQLKLFSRPHEQMLGATVHWFSLTMPKEGTEVRMAKWSKAKEGTKHLDIKECQWTLLILILQQQRCWPLQHASIFRILARLPEQTNGGMCPRIISFYNQFLHSIKC